ncbi:MAG: ComF family protein [Rhodoferax sp.]
MFVRLLQGLRRRIASQCAVCHAWPAQPVCDACVAQFAQPLPRCRTCALALPAGLTQCGACLRSPPPLDACLCALPYAYPWSSLVAEFKFRQHPGWASQFALLLRSAPWVEPALEQADWLLPMPLSRERLQERGYNQSQLLAEALEPGKIQAATLLRIRHTPPQSSLPRAERLRNVQHAFAVDPLRGQAMRGRRVVLVDDVMTSGASLYAAAQMLRQAGAAHITGLVLARTD